MPTNAGLVASSLENRYVNGGLASAGLERGDPDTFLRLTECNCDRGIDDSPKSPARFPVGRVVMRGE